MKEHEKRMFSDPSHWRDHKSKESLTISNEFFYEKDNQVEAPHIVDFLVIH